MMGLKTLLAFTTAGLLVWASPAHSAQIIVQDVSASSTFGTYNIDNLVNGNGLTGNTHSGDFTTKWLAGQNDVTPTITFDFGSVFAVDGMSIWNYGGGCCGEERSVQSFDLYGSLDGLTYALIGSYNLDQSPGTPIPEQLFGLNTTAQYLRFDVTSNFGSQSYTGLSEVQFTGVQSAAVPEPGTWAMMLMGFGAMGLALRRRRQFAFA